MAHATTPTHGSVCRTVKNSVAMEFTEGWTVHAEVDLAAIARQGKSWKAKLPGQGDWNGSFNGQLVLGNTEQKAVVDNIINAAPGTKLTDMQFQLDAVANYISGDIFIKSIDIGAPIGDKVDFTVNWEGDESGPTLNPA